MKKVLFLLSMSLLVCCPAWSQDDEEEFPEEEPSGSPEEPRGVIIDGLEYFFSSEKGWAYLRCNNSWDGELVIPAEVEHDGVTYTVEGMSWKSFRDCQTLTKVTIPNTLTFFFKWGSYADFSPQWVPFVGCIALESIEVDEDNPWFCSVDGVMYTKTMTDLVCFPANSKLSTYTVPDGVKSIYEDAFAFNKNLISVTLPNTVSTMYSCFRGCTALESVILPQNLSVLPSYVFSDCKSLKSIEIPSGVTGVQYCAFEGCSSLTVVDLPESVSYIKAAAFKDCSSLKTLVIRGYLEDDKISEQWFGEKYYPQQATIYTLPEQIDKFKKYFTGTILPLDMYQPEAESATSIQPAKADHPAGVSTYDLQGRRLTQKPEKGVYIENGRKRVVK
jgi:hypothetical protein